jgi:hypothetical protein
MNEIGRVLRASTTCFAAGCRVTELEGPAFGAMVKAFPLDGREAVYGIIYDLHIQDDPVVRQLIVAQDVPSETVEDQRHNRRVPIEIEIVTIGYQTNGMPQHQLPPRPPISLDPVYLCSDEEVRAFTERLDFLRLLLNSREVPVDELIVTCLHLAVQARPESERRPFLLNAGRELARLMGGDLVRLEALLGRLGRLHEITRSGQ